jgi:uncharacterized protein involved in cysteine biosynthesis
MGVLTGPLALLRAVGLLIRHPSLLGLAMLPCIATVVVSALGVYASIQYGETLLQAVWPSLATGAGSGVAVGFFTTTTVLLALVVTPWLVMLVGLPLCEPLASKADVLLGGQEVEGTFVNSVANSIVTTVMLVGFGIGGSIILFTLGLIPGLALLTVPFAALVWTPLFLSFELQDSSMGRRRLPFRRKARVVSGNPFSSLSLGLVGLCLIAVPVVNLLGLPLAVLSGVIVVRDLEKKGKLDG